MERWENGNERRKEARRGRTVESIIIKAVPSQHPEQNDKFIFSRLRDLVSAAPRYSGHMAKMADGFPRSRRAAASGGLMNPALNDGGPRPGNVEPVEAARGKKPFSCDLLQRSCTNHVAQLNGLDVHLVLLIQPSPYSDILSGQLLVTYLLINHSPSSFHSVLFSVAANQRQRPLAPQ